MTPKPPPKRKEKPARRLVQKGGRVFNVGRNWIARLGDQQEVATDQDEAARKLLQRLDI